MAGPDSTTSCLLLPPHCLIMATLCLSCEGRRRTWRKAVGRLGRYGGGRSSTCSPPLLPLFSSFSSPPPLLHASSRTPRTRFALVFLFRAQAVAANNLDGRCSTLNFHASYVAAKQGRRSVTLCRVAQVALPLANIISTTIFVAHYTNLCLCLDLLRQNADLCILGGQDSLTSGASVKNDNLYAAPHTGRGSSLPLGLGISVVACLRAIPPALREGG